MGIRVDPRRPDLRTQQFGIDELDTTAAQDSTTVTGAADTATQDTTTSTTPAQDPTLAAAQDALPKFLAVQPGLVSSSDVVSDTNGLHTAFSQVGEEYTKVRWPITSNRTWTPVASIALPFPSYPLARRGLETLDITGDQLVDFVVPLDAAAPIAVVVSSDGGAWRTLQVNQSDTPEVYLASNPRVINGELVSTGSVKRNHKVDKLVAGDIQCL